MTSSPKRTTTRRPSRHPRCPARFHGVGVEGTQRSERIPAFETRAVRLPRPRGHARGGDRRRTGTASWNWARSVDPSIASVDAVPPETTWATSSKYPVPTNDWCSIALYPRAFAADSASWRAAYAGIPDRTYSEARWNIDWFNEWKPASVTNWNLYPRSPRSAWNRAIPGPSSCCRQWKDAEQLYARYFPGNRAWIASANARASSTSGPQVSHQTRSA